jgi:hypothetical protein
MEYIQGEKFKLLDNNTSIFYRNIDCALDFLKNPPKNNFIFITHNGDMKIDDVFFDKIPDNLIKWYGQNINIKHNKIESLPIGIENNKWFIDVFNKKYLFENKIKENKTNINLLYINHNIQNNINERLKPYEIFSDKSWCTIHNGSNGVFFDIYLNNIYNHKFVLCPEGNGTDTHRTWECLYLNTIPIEKRNINNSYYRDLPICFVDYWEEITEEFLNKEYDRILSASWNLQKLDFNFWKNKILTEKI